MYLIRAVVILFGWDSNLLDDSSIIELENNESITYHSEEWIVGMSLADYDGYDYSFITLSELYDKLGFIFDLRKKLAIEFEPKLFFGSRYS